MTSGDAGHGQPGLAQQALRVAGRDELPAEADEPWANSIEAGLVVGARSARISIDIRYAEIDSHVAHSTAR